MGDFKKQRSKNRSLHSSLLESLNETPKTPKAAGRPRMKSRREMKENALTPMKTIDAKPIEVNTSTRSVKNISVDEAMKTGADMTKSVQPNMSKQEIREENKYLRQSEKGTWDKNVAKETKKNKIKQAKQEFKSKYPFGASKSIVNGETSQMRDGIQGVQPISAPTKIMSDLEKMAKRRGY